MPIIHNEEQGEFSYLEGKVKMGKLRYRYIKDDVIDVGKNAVNAVSGAVDKVGDAISGFGKTLGSVFG